MANIDLSQPGVIIDLRHKSRDLAESCLAAWSDVGRSDTAKQIYLQDVYDSLNKLLDFVRDESERQRNVMLQEIEEDMKQ
jgi:hypothetical protein